MSWNQAYTADQPNDTDFYLKELCLEVAQGNVGGQRFNDLLIKTGVFLDDHEWFMTNRLLAASERVDYLAALTTASLN